ncbi:MAG: serine/threonine protein kinase [Planctomycetaceae bacterium]|nr:serine/threonine protein kinase [Planctomycetaceae bacterium]
MDSANKSSGTPSDSGQKPGEEFDAGALVGSYVAGGRYKLQRLAGEGSMAHVYMAWDDRLSTDVVVKIPKPDRIQDAAFRLRFTQERQLLVKLSHPHIVRVLDMGEHEDLPFLVMQYLSGGDLLDQLQKIQQLGKRVAVTSVRQWLREIARALDFVADQGMVHRDVKPSNILFDNHGNAFLSDFGLARITYGEHVDTDSEMTGAGFVVGTPNYLAPELIFGQPFDGRADQYALGLVIYHLLTGSPPMQGASSAATMVNQTTKVPPFLNRVRKDVPEAFALAVQKAIHKKPEQRFASSTEFADAVLASLTSTGSGTRPAAGAGRLKPAATVRKPPERKPPERERAGAMDTAFEQPPKISTGPKGLVTCPACRVPLPLLPAHAGRRGRCIHCHTRLKISKNLTKLIQLPEDEGGTRPRRSDGSGELIIGEKVFGWQLSRKTAMTIASVLLLITLCVTVYLTVFLTGKSDQEKLKDRIKDSGKTTESDSRE